MLEERVRTPGFLETLERACSRAQGGRRVLYQVPASSSSFPSPPTCSSSAAAAANDVLSPEWWSLPAGVVVEEEEEEEEGGGAEGEDDDREVTVFAVSSSDNTASPSASSPPSLLEGDSNYVVISKDDAVEAIAHFIASYVASLPQARDLDPKALRSALATTLGELRRGKVKRLWAWGKWLYRAAALSYGAFGAYTNPWLARAVLAAVWTGAKVMFSVAVGVGGA